MQKLDFTEKLLQTGKGGATSALLTRLKVGPFFVIVNNNNS